MKIVSACLAGVKCRWNGEAKPCQKVIELIQRNEAIPVCPEFLGWLSIPRSAAEQKDGRVLTQNGEDVTEQFEKWAEEAMRIAKLTNCNEAIMKSKSPSCGSGKIYDGTFSKNLIAGDGVFTRLLKKNNIKVFTEDEI